MTVDPIRLSDVVAGFAEQGDIIVREVLDQPSDLVALELVPVEVFGADAGYGLSDAVEAWSDCNRAIGRIYRVEDIHGPRLPGDTVTIYVRAEDVAFFSKRFGER